MGKLMQSVVLSTGCPHTKKAQRPTGEPEQFWASGVKKKRYLERGVDSWGRVSAHVMNHFYFLTLPKYTSKLFPYVSSEYP